MEWTAVATLVLALIATVSIVVTLVIRANDIKRASDAKALDEIHNWAQEGIRLCGLHIVRDSIEAWDLKAKRIADLKALKSSTGYITVVARRFENKLSQPINQAVQALETYIQEIGIESLNGSEITNIDKSKWKEFEQRFIEAMEAISKLKGELKL